MSWTEAGASRSALVGVLARAALAGVATFAVGCQERATIPIEEPAVVYGADRIAFTMAELPSIAEASGRERSIGSVLNVPAAMDYGDFVWSDKGVPPGDVWVLVDLKAQTMSVFRGKHEVGTAVTLYGADEKPTPTGRFTVIEKRKDHRSSIYDAPMPYTLRLTTDGIAIHGSDVREGAATHGCLGVPLDFGSLLFDAVKVGDEVLILEDAGADGFRDQEARSGDLALG